MSGKVQREETRKIDLQSIILRVNELRDIIAVLQDQVTSLSQELTELRLAQSTIKGLEEVPGEVEALISIDRLGSTFIPSRIPSDWSNMVLVNIGKNYYAKVGKDRALKILSSRIASLENILRLRRQELTRAINEYNYLQQILQSIYIQAQAAAREQTGSRT